MSQSDYIQHKKIANVLKDQSNLANTVNGQEFTEFKTFDIANRVNNTTLTYNQLGLSNKQRVFNMEMDVSGNCAHYSFCVNPKTRTNRKNMNLRMFTYNPQHVSKDGYFWNQKQREMLCLEKEFKECDEYYYRRRIWFKKE